MRRVTFSRWRAKPGHLTDFPMTHRVDEETGLVHDGYASFARYANNAQFEPQIEADPAVERS